MQIHDALPLETAGADDGVIVTTYPSSKRLYMSLLHESAGIDTRVLHTSIHSLLTTGVVTIDVHPLKPSMASIDGRSPP